MMRAAVAETAEAETEEAEFCRLVSARLDGAYQLAGYILGSASEAQDATQDAIARAWQGFGALRDRQAFDQWFRRILVNGCRDRLRRRRRVRFVPLEEQPDDLEAADPFQSSLALDELGRALDVLGPEERTVVVLHYWNDLSTAEIGALLGIAQGTVKYRLHSAYGALRRRLEEASRERPR